MFPEIPPFMPNQFNSCAVVGSSADVKEVSFGAEIDNHEAVFRVNDAPTRRYETMVGRRTTFRVLNNMGTGGSHKEHPGEVALLKGDLSSGFFKVNGNSPAYVLHMPKANYGSAGGTGRVAVDFAVSVCKHVDIYGFATELGYKEWTRYFSNVPGEGHHPLRGIAFYTVMECIGALTIRAPNRPLPRYVPTLTDLAREMYHQFGYRECGEVITTDLLRQQSLLMTHDVSRAPTWPSRQDRRKYVVTDVGRGTIQNQLCIDKHQ
mmetsp:Transcript_28661/g.62769  ORF Transcript_28661/g.62769 Transcript_28661/m.62769 type:complete len:263 (+) Transcript_28661:752-1540(+)